MRKKDENEIEIKGVTDRHTSVFAPKNKGGAPYLMNDPKEQEKLQKLKKFTEDIEDLFPTLIIRVANGLVENDKGELVEQKPTGYTFLALKDKTMRGDAEMLVSVLSAQVAYEIRDLSRVLKIDTPSLGINILSAILWGALEGGDATKKELWKKVLALLPLVMPDEEKADLEEFKKDPAKWAEKNEKNKK